MRTKIFLASLVIVCALSGCVIPTKEYVKQHPELSPQHRKIILSGRIKFGDDVAGMTREQIRLVMGTDPDQFDSINGEDTWTWFHSKAARDQSASTGNGSNSPNMGVGGGGGGAAGGGGGGGGGRHQKDNTTDSTPMEAKPGSRTTVFFKGDTATRVEFGTGQL